MDSINIKGLPKRAVLQALYNRADSPGMGILHRRSEPLSDADADAALASGTYFDYLHGRVMKVDLSGDTLDPWLYDRDNGQGAAACALAPLLSQQEGLSPMDPAPTLLDYQSLAAEAETVILRHGLTPRAVHLYPVSPYNTPRVVVTIDPAALRSLFPEHTSRISGNVLLTREVVDGRVLIESGEYLPKSEPA